MTAAQRDTETPKRHLQISDVLQLSSFHEAHGRGFAFSPDGQWLAFCVQRPLCEATRHTDMFLSGIARSELYVVEIATLQVVKVAADEDCFAPAWSPDGRRLAFGIATHDAVRLAVQDMRSGERYVPPLGNLQLTGMRPFDWIDDDRLIAVQVPNGERPWMLDMELSGARKATAAWAKLDTPGLSTASCLESNAGQRPETPSRIAHAFVIHDTARRCNHDLEEHAHNPLVVEFQTRFASGHQAGLERGNLVCDQTLPDGEVVAIHEPSAQALFLVEDGLGSRLLRMNTSTGAQVEMFRANTHLADVQAGEIRDLEYTDAQGKLRRVRLILPPGHVPGTRSPAVFWVYPGSGPGSKVRPYLKMHEPTMFNLQLLAAQGYVVVEPRLPIEPAEGALDLAQTIAEHMEIAIGIALGSGLIDEDCMHVMGHSFGGWAVMSLLTTTSRFKSGIAIAGISELIGYHGSCDPRFRYDERSEYAFGAAEMCERTWRLGAPPWKDVDRYVRNSPLFAIEKITAPLMIVQGDQDYVPITQGEAMFSALRAVGKKSRFVRYWGEGHILGNPANIEDLWSRIFEWLGEAEAPPP